MIKIHEKFVVNDKGEKTAVILDIKEYNELIKMLKDMEEFDCLDINENIARGLKDVEDNNIYPIESLFSEK